MSMNTRSELEEERRLFYVALTRAKERAFLSYTISRYRWGKLIDAEPSRFIEEIDPQYVNHIKLKDDYTFKPLINTSIFDRNNISKNDYRLKEKMISKPTTNELRKLQKIQHNKTNRFDHEVLNLKKGMKVQHDRFGYGEVESIEGKGNDRKAIINFKGFGSKNLLLRFAKLKIK
tara:strand:- start:371 stop:895 length:525 start_codon:yes stop_codon:yes gene_type:complete